MNCFCLLSLLLFQSSERELCTGIVIKWDLSRFFGLLFMVITRKEKPLCLLPFDLLCSNWQPVVMSTRSDTAFA
jgi:hypothetical protein